jgi:S-formylglutathione hydrolase FrmB
VTLRLPTAHGPGKVEMHTFHSTMLGVDKRYAIYLPGGYGASPDDRWPVVYYLNGLGGDETNWSQEGDLGGAADKLGLAAIVVMPDGDDGFYANSVTPRDDAACMKDGTGLFDSREDRASTCVKKADYEDYIVKDLIAHVDGTYATIADRRARGIAGLSMGGFGALELAMRHTDLFSAAASHSGVDALLYVGPHPYEPGKAVITDDVKTWGVAVEPIGGWVRAIFGPDRVNWEQHDPAVLAQKLSTDPRSPDALALYLDCGTEDFFGLDAEAAYLHDLLTKRGIAHSYYIGPGRHDFDFWKERVGHSLAFFAAHFAGEPEPVETPATATAAPAQAIAVTNVIAGAGVDGDLAEHLREGLEQGAKTCAQQAPSPDGARELAIGVTDQAQIADVKWLGGAEPDAFAQCLIGPVEPSMDSVKYVYAVLSVGVSAAPTPPTVAGDLDEVCHAMQRSGAKPGAGDSASKMAAYVFSHVRHPDVLAMLHDMAIADARKKMSILTAELAKAKIPAAKCPFAKGT